MNKVLNSYRALWRWAARAAVFGLFCGSFVTAMVSTVVSQSNTPDPVKQKLQDEKDKADLQKAIADDQKAIAQDEADKLKSQYSISTDKLPQGNATLGDKVSIEATILAYRAARSASGKIADSLTSNGGAAESSAGVGHAAALPVARNCPSVFLFYDAKQMNDVWANGVLKAQLKLMQQQGASLSAGPDSQGLIPIAEAINAGLALLALFKTDTNIQGVPVTGDDFALQLAIASDLHTYCSSAAIIDPTHFIPSMQPTTDLTTLLSLVGSLSDLRSGISDKVTKAQADLKLAQKALDDAKGKLDANNKATADLSGRIQDLTKKLEEAKTPAAKAEISKQLEVAKADLSKSSSEKTKIEGDIANRTAQTDRLTAYSNKAGAFVSSVDTLSSALTKVDDSGITLLNRMLRAESLATNISSATRFVSVHFVAIGGNNITKKNFFSTSISYSGGTVISYLLTDNQGKILKSGTTPVYGKKVSEGELNDTLE
jgi:hypothetical protein